MINHQIDQNKTNIFTMIDKKINSRSTVYRQYKFISRIYAEFMY